MLGVKRLSTIEKGDIIVAQSNIKIYELADNGTGLRLVEVDNVIKNDTVGFFTGDIVPYQNLQYVEFVTPDALLPDGSPDFMRIRRYMLWDTDFDYQVNPAYHYPDRKAEARIFDVFVNWTRPQRFWLIAGIFSTLMLVGVGIAYVMKRSRKSRRIRGAAA